MSIEREKQIEFVRSDLMGPARPIVELNDKVEVLTDGSFVVPSGVPSGIPLFRKITEEGAWQEIVHLPDKSPFEKYGIGLLYAEGVSLREPVPTSADSEENEGVASEVEFSAIDEKNQTGPEFTSADTDAPLDNGLGFDVSNQDLYRPSTMGLSFCISEMEGTVIVRVPSEVVLPWQKSDLEPFQVNGYYVRATKKVQLEERELVSDAWLRKPATGLESFFEIDLHELAEKRRSEFQVPVIEDAPMNLVADCFARKINGQWIITLVMRNKINDGEVLSSSALMGRTLFQSYFHVEFPNTKPAPYPDSVRPFDDFEEEEKSLSLLYSDTTVWAVGHTCSAGWDVENGEIPNTLCADFLPAVELPSMTPDISDVDGNPLVISMSSLSDDSKSWFEDLESLVESYENWIESQINEISKLDPKYRSTAESHVDKCRQCAERMWQGIHILKRNGEAKKAFEIANKAMYLQQLATKKIKRRPLEWNGEYVASSQPSNPRQAYPNQLLSKSYLDLGNWRAFQIAFFLMSISGIVDEENSADHDVVDLIWFPTGGGKTEAYLGVAAFYMAYQRLLMNCQEGLERDGTSVFMRYTLRMLTTQQFQRAASLILALEHIRKQEISGGCRILGETRFSLGLWIGDDGAPNKVKDAHSRVLKYFKENGDHGNPLVLTECPWCKSEIGFLKNDPRDSMRKLKPWNKVGWAGFSGDRNNKLVVLKCSDNECEFGGEFGTIPVEVIDERMYAAPPSLFIGTADKFAMLAYRPEAGALFGRSSNLSGEIKQIKRPPGLILQDEMHLISGPLGTLYGLYETAIEELCTFENESGKKLKPKIIASTATIRGADQQVKSVFNRSDVQLFPSPGLKMSDSFFGTYSRSSDGKLSSGRLYLGIQATNYSSFLTTQVRLFNASLFRTTFFEDDKKDAWWTLLVFYNSLRELGGGRTLFTSDIASRMNNYNFYRYDVEKSKRRYLNKVIELTSRKSQAELVSAMDELDRGWNKKSGAVDACLASNIIEVGVDIDRLAMMAVVGQPKSTAQYIQVTGRVGRRWWERPGLIFAMYSPSKSRDQSHFEQFHSYHRRLYEQVEPTSATPFSIESIQRGAVGAFLLWARQQYRSRSPSGELPSYLPHLEYIKEVMIERAESIVNDPSLADRARNAIESVYSKLIKNWGKNPLMWEEYPHKQEGEYLLLRPDQTSTSAQKAKGFVVPTSLRSVDGSSYMRITTRYMENSEEE